MKKSLIWCAVLLWILHGAVLVVIAEPDLVGVVSKSADIAREKDIVWLSLATAIVSIAFSAWLVKTLIAQQSVALTQNAKSMAALDALREELQRRPCVIHQAISPQQPLPQIRP